MNLLSCSGGEANPLLKEQRRWPRGVERVYNKLRMGLGVGQKCSYNRECLSCDGGAKTTAAHTLFECVDFSECRECLMENWFEQDQKATFLEGDIGLAMGDECKGSKDVHGVRKCAWGDSMLLQKHAGDVLRAISESVVGG
jgi:hypothetical protein